MKINYYIPLKLKGLVDKIWEHTSHTSHCWTILPSGKIELMFRIGSAPDLIEAKKIGSDENPMRNFAFMSGLQTRPLIMTLDSMHFIGIKMSPVAFKAFFGMPLALITDYYLPGSHFLQTLNEIEDRLNDKGTFTEKAQWLENLLYSFIIETPELHMAMALGEVSQKFIQSNTLYPNHSIETLMGYSRTHTFRLFKEWFGTSPHRYQRLQQFVNVMHYLHQIPGNLTGAALKNGYFDQPHFIRSFKAFSGITPGEYVKRKTHIPGQIPG